MSFDMNDSTSLANIELHLDRISGAQPDLATRVAADIFARMVVQGIDLEKSNWEFYPDEKRYAEDVAGVAVKSGRIFAEAVARAKEPKP